MNPTAENDFSTGSIPAHMLRLALPMTLAQLINVLYNIIDRIFIGRIPFDSTNALTGLGVAFPICTITIAFANLVGMGGAPLFSIERGKRNDAEAEKILGNSFVLLLMFGLFITITGLLLKRPLLYLLGASEATFRYADSYITIYLCGSVFVMLSLGLNSFINAQGFAKTGMLTVLIGAVCNIVLDPLFIFVFHMGVKGAALATILSQGVSCVWVCTFLRGKKTLLRLKNENIRLRPQYFLPCVALGAASFIMQASESVISVCFNTSLLKYGGDIAVGAMTILTSVMQFAMLPLQGLAQGAQPVLSYNYGAKNAARVKQAFRLLLTSSLVYSTVLWGCIQLFPQVFASIFTPNEDLIVFAAKALRIYCGVLVLFGIQIACQMTFVSLGNAPCSIIVAVVRKFVLLIPLIYLMPQLVSNQVMGVYMAEPVADVIAVTFTAILFSHQFRKSMTALEQEAKQQGA